MVEHYQHQRQSPRRNQPTFFNRRHKRICQRVTCQNATTPNKRTTHHVNIIRPPPLFHLEPPPDPSHFLTLQQNTDIFTDLIICHQHQSPLTESDPIIGTTYTQIEPPNPLPIRPDVSTSTLGTLTPPKRLLDATSLEYSTSISTPTSLNKSTSFLSFFMVFGTSMLIVLALCILFYLWIRTRTKKRKSKTNSGYIDTSSDQVNSSSISQCSYTSDSNQQKDSLMKNFRNEQLSQLQHQCQHLLALDPPEFSQFIPSNPTNETFKTYQANHVNQMVNQMHYDLLSMPKTATKGVRKQGHHPAELDTRTKRSKQNNQKINKKKLSSFKKTPSLSISTKVSKHLGVPLDICGCSTLSTRATNESSSSTSSTSTPGSTKLSSANTNESTSQGIKNCYESGNNNHYQKLFLNANGANGARTGMNGYCAQYEQANIPNYIMSNVTNTYVPNKVALLCNAESGMPQLIKVMDIKELNDYVQLMNSDPQARQLGIDHYENFCTQSPGLKPSALNYKDQMQSKAESDEVYELIEDLVPFNQLDTSLNSNNNFQASSSMLKRKYPKTNPNYNHSNVLNSSFRAKT